MKLHKLYITEADEPAPEADAETRIDTAAGTALKAEKFDLGQAGLDALMFIISVMIHGTLSKAISRKLLRPAKGLRAANLIRKRRFMKMAKAGHLRGKFGAAAVQSVKGVNQVAIAVEEGGDAAADNPDVVDGVSAMVAAMEPGEERAKTGKPDIAQDAKEISQINDLANNVADVLNTLKSGASIDVDGGGGDDDDDFNFSTDDLDENDVDLGSGSDAPQSPPPTSPAAYEAKKIVAAAAEKAGKAFDIDDPEQAKLYAKAKDKADKANGTGKYAK